MGTKKCTIIAAWLMTLIFLVCAFLPLLQFSFNRYSVNLFGICEEFASRDRAGLRHYAPLGYLSFAIIALTAIAQVLSLIRVMKNTAKGKLAPILTVVSIVVLAGYLLLVSIRADYTLTPVPFIFLAAGCAYIVLFSKAKKAQINVFKAISL